MSVRCSLGRTALATTFTSLALLLAALPAAAGIECPGYTDIRFCGEVTGDCKVTASDSLSTLRMAVGQTGKLTEADVSLDGDVTAVDALRVLRVAVGSLPRTLSCGNQRGLLATAVGLYSDSGVRSPNNHAVGWYSGGGVEFRNYMVFDLSSVDGQITSGLLHVSTAPDAQNAYHSADPSETYTVSDVAMPVATLTSGGGQAAFADLAAGTVYASRVVSSPLAHVIDVTLNSDGLDYLNEKSGLVALGGAITTLAKGVTDEYIMNSTTVTTERHLILYVE